MELDNEIAHNILQHISRVTSIIKCIFKSLSQRQQRRVLLEACMTRSCGNYTRTQAVIEPCEFKTSYQLTWLNGWPSKKSEWCATLCHKYQNIVGPSFWVCIACCCCCCYLVVCCMLLGWRLRVAWLSFGKL